MAEVNWRTINIDALEPDSCYNFDLATLTPAVEPISHDQVQTLCGQIRQLLRGGDAEGALRGALENVPYGADEKDKTMYLSAVAEILGQIRQAEMSPLLERIYQNGEGSELCDALMKFLYKGMGQTGQTKPTLATTSMTGFSQAGGRHFGGGGDGNMNVFLSWHEKLVEMVGPGSIVRVMTDRRRV
ncbi:Arp2/3 complex 16 kDa subunit ARPC5 [Piedraia hortae CBS 480.64]|uniref:Actin-related protein 2/3 complex subunit 5 n=1 Tax=Piedraia hortae CBS 480.64 TaxID=1314780 RepID=A0A6A7BYV8_9PEZI|nr:Arp2/3 complex 16 kDa subunit ARPC5 [Piedraia hortae CBS 480.64]